MSSIEDVINHYQTSINKSLNDTARIVHCIGKLYKLPISVRHLQETGIGRTVNSLRKYDGEVGIAAKALVTKWKAMVAAEESDDGAAGSGPHVAGDQGDDQHNGDRQERSDMSDEEEDDGGGHDGAMANEDDPDDDGTNASNGGEEEETYDESQLIGQGEQHCGVGEQSNSDSECDSDDQTEQQRHNHHHNKIMEEKPSSSHWNEHHSRSAEGKERHSAGSNSRNHHNHHSPTTKQSSSSGSRHKHASGSKPETDHLHHGSSGGGGGGTAERGSDSKSHKSSSSGGNGSSRKSSSHCDTERHKERSSSKHHTGSSRTNEIPAGSGGSSSHGSSRNTRKDSSHKDSRHHRSKEDKSTGSSKRHAQNAVDAGDELASSAKRSRKEQRHEHGAVAVESPSSTSHSKHSSKASPSSSSSKHRQRKEKSGEKAGETKSKSKRKNKASAPVQEEANGGSEGEDVAEGLDGSGGASFADALAMIGMPGSGSKKKSSGGGSGREREKVTVTKNSPSTGGHSSTTKLSSSSSRSGRRDDGIPSSSELLSSTVKLEPLPEASEIVEALPMISPHYRPMPLNQTVMDCVFMGGGGQGGRGQRRPLTEEEALGQSMQSKNLRTKVYSGMKTNSKGVVLTLYDLCIRILQDNIEELRATGGIPFYILRPVLERATPDQLFTLEHFNPHLVEDSDVLWELHCKRTFRTKQRNEEDLETWREMFLRCSDERDAKLKSLTQNIKLAQQQAAAPVRKTQLAYVDSAAKPPRNVISKQIKYGTARAPVVSPAARVAALKAGNVAQVGDARLRVLPGVRDNAQAQIFHPTKPRKAPMMAKVLSSMKGFKTSFRR